MSSVGGAVLIGIIAALASELPKVLHGAVPDLFWYAAWGVLLVVVVSLAFQLLIRKKQWGDPRYDGLGDMLIHIHWPTHPDSPARWGLRGIISFLLTLFGIGAGTEGAAIELSHGMAIRNRSRSSRWFEQRRRTDAALALAAGVAAAFQAPFAAVLLPLELGIGGRTMLVAVASLTAFLASRVIWHMGSLGLLSGEGARLDSFDVAGALTGYHFDSFSQWTSVLVVAVAAGLLGVLVTQLIRFGRDSLTGISAQRFWLRTVIGGVLIMALFKVVPEAEIPPWSLLEQVLWQKKSLSELVVLFSAELLTLVLVLSAFGTAGVFWPLFLLGGLVGNALGLAGLAGTPDSIAALGLLGSAAFLGSVMGAPVAGAVLAFELTQNVNVLLPAMLAALLARQIRVWLKSQPLVDRDLEARGIRLLEGRSITVLDSILVRDAMVTDHETVHELEPLGELRGRLLRSRYPFLPVVNSHGIYSGFITVDMVRESLQASDEGIQTAASNVPLSRLLEAKDILYRSGFKTKTLKLHDSLSVTAGLFEEIPCVPVLDEHGKVVGLLFVHHVRLAYDREVARRSFIGLPSP